ncbi:MAG: M14 family metallocarboxypeptidase [Opitutus sp.]
MTPPPRSVTFDPGELVAKFLAVAPRHGFRIEHYGTVAGCPLIALTKHTPGPRPRWYFSSGIHGDEPAPPLALLTMLEAGVFDHRANWFICPMLNPSGFVVGSRESATGLDLNRDYKQVHAAEIRAHIAWLGLQPNFDASVSLHEDWESTGFYLYELNPENRPSFADRIIAAVSKVCPIDSAAVIDGREIAAPGIIRPIADPLLREDWPESIYLRAHHTNLTYTLESPSALQLPQRIAALRAAVESIV